MNGFMDIVMFAEKLALLKVRYGKYFVSENMVKF